MSGRRERRGYLILKTALSSVNLKPLCLSITSSKTISAKNAIYTYLSRTFHIESHINTWPHRDPSCSLSVPLPACASKDLNNGSFCLKGALEPTTTESSSQSMNTVDAQLVFSDRFAAPVKISAFRKGWNMTRQHEDDLSSSCLNHKPKIFSLMSKRVKTENLHI